MSTIIKFETEGYSYLIKFNEELTYGDAERIQARINIIKKDDFEHELQPSQIIEEALEYLGYEFEYIEPEYELEV